MHCQGIRKEKKRKEKKRKEKKRKEKKRKEKKRKEANLCGKTSGEYEKPTKFFPKSFSSKKLGFDGMKQI
jgi:hypothetical protein